MSFHAKALISPTNTRGDTHFIIALYKFPYHQHDPSMTMMTKPCCHIVSPTVRNLVGKYHGNYWESMLCCQPCGWIPLTHMNRFCRCGHPYLLALDEGGSHGYVDSLWTRFILLCCDNRLCHSLSHLGRTGGNRHGQWLSGPDHLADWRQCGNVLLLFRRGLNGRPGCDRWLPVFRNAV